MTQPELPPTDTELVAADGLVRLSVGPTATPEEVAKEASKRSSIVLYNWKTLADILDRHEEDLRKKWTKKTRAWKENVLRQAWGPETPDHHRLDMEILLQDESPIGPVHKKPRGPFLWPYINTEDLGLEKPLLCLLNTRARSPPEVFVNYELEICHLGLRSHTIVPVQVKGYTMYLEGETVDTYGKVVAVGDYDNGYNSNSVAGFQPGDGLLILEIQQRLMGFLVKCCEIIKDEPAAILVGSQYPVKQNLPALEAVSSNSNPTTEILARYAPYLPPREVDFTKLKALIDAWYALAQDHVWALREDPGYFEDNVRAWADHRQEHILDSMGKLHWTFARDQSQFWDIVVLNVVNTAYACLIAWSVLAKQAHLVVALQKKHARLLDRRYTSPPEYKKEIQIFRALLHHFSNSPLDTLRYCIPASPLLRSAFVRQIQPDGTTRSEFRDGAHGELGSLLWVFQTTCQPVPWHDYGAQDIVDEMERQIFAEPEQRKRISPFIAEQLAFYGLTVRVKHEVDNYHPWATDYRGNEFSQEDVDKELREYLADLVGWISNIQSFALGEVGKPVQERWFYPCDTRMNESHAQSMQKAEENLDLFWREVDKQYKKSTGGEKGLQDDFAHRFTVTYELERTSEWIEPPNETSAESRKQDPTEQKVDNLREPVSNLKLEQRMPRPNYVLVVAAYSIQFHDLPPDANYANWSNGKALGQPLFKLDHRATRVTKALFDEPSDQDRPREIAWGDFLHFMSAMNFSPLKLYGSLWHFDNPLAHPIQFFEPQPDSKITLRVAMRMGRRLRRTYKWHAEMFERPAQSS